MNKFEQQADLKTIKCARILGNCRKQYNKITTPRNRLAVITFLNCVTVASVRIVLEICILISKKEMRDSQNDYKITRKTAERKF